MLVLNTPIKKIKNLSLHSPKPPSPVRYPSMSDFTVEDPIFHNMVDKGYLKTISNKVLLELDTRASEISNRLNSNVSHAVSAATKKKRYSGIHRPLFSKMELISSHYAASRGTETSPSHDFPSSATKKRRTLNGPEEIFGKENESPTRKPQRCGEGETAQQSQRKAGFTLLAPSLGMTPSLAPDTAPSLAPVTGNINSLRSSPIRMDTREDLARPASRMSRLPSRNMELPSRSGDLSSSPGKFTKISPSKGSMNLNSLLHGDEFAKPVKIRQSSLQMAGVSNLQKQPSISNLQKKPSIPQLQKKSSIPQLQKKPSIPQLQKKPSIPQLQKKTLIPQLQKKPSIPQFNTKPVAQVSSQFSSHSLSTNTFQKPLKPVSKIQSLPRDSARDTTRDTSGYISRDRSSVSLNRKASNSNITIPKPFSLYDRPTISSSQKSLGNGQVSSSNSSRSISSLNSQASQRSLNRFQKFKSRFS